MDTRTVGALFGLLCASSCVVSAPEPTSATGLACVKGTARTLERYLKLDPELNPAEIESYWECLDRAVVVFEERVQGARPGIYTAHEVRGFVTSLVFPGARISDGFLDRAMRMKALLLGGSPMAVTRSDLARAREWIQGLKRDSLLLQRALLRSSVAEIQAVANSVLVGWGERIAGHGVDVPFDSLSQLLSDLAEFTDRRALSELFSSFRVQLVWLKRYKRDFMNSVPDSIGAAEWPDLFLSASRVVGLYLQAKELRRREYSLVHGEGRRLWMAWIQSALEFVSDRVRTSEGWSYEALSDWIQGAGPWLPAPIEGFALASAARATLRWVLDSGEGGVTSAALDRMREALARWSDGQEYLDRLASHLAHTESGVGSDRVGWPARKWLEIRDSDLGWESANLGAREDVRTVLSQKGPVFQNEEYRLSFASTERLSLHHATVNYLLREVARHIVRAGGPQATEITLEQFWPLYLGFKELALELKLIGGPDPDALIARRFQEANLFTSAADGNSKVSVAETAQMIAYSFSTKLHASRIHSELEGLCQHMGTDIYGRPSLNALQYQREFFKGVDRHWQRLPLLLEYYRGLNSNGAIEAFERRFLQATVGARVLASGAIGSADTDAVVMVPYYIEALFLRFDWNRDQRLDVPESLKIYPLFKAGLQKASGMSGDWELTSLFTYILSKGAPPANSILGKASFAKWMLSRPFWDFESDRGMIVKMFASLSKPKAPQ